MSSDWKTCTLDELGPIKTGKTPPSSLGYGFGGTVPFVTPGDMNGQKWITDTDRYLNASGLIAVRSSLMPARSVAVSCIGSDMGKAALLSRSSVTNQQINTIAVDESRFNAEFVYYDLSVRQQELKTAASGSATPILNKGHFSAFEILVPPRATQDKIAEILGRLDEKIDLNRRINQTLEAMAQAIFKSWFVDFDPVKAKIAAKQEGRDPLRAAMSAISGKPDAELDALSHGEYDHLATTAALFPDAMQESELGGIPKGWTFTDFGAVSTCFDRQRIPLSSSEREKKRGFIPYYGATSVIDYVDDAIFDGVYLLLGEDGSVLKSDGTPFVQYIWGKSWVNNHAHVLQGSQGLSTEQLMLFVSTQKISAYVTGAVQLKLNQKNMNSIPFVKAPSETNERFSELITPFFAQYRSLVEEIRSLTELRDALLPKLLSGELSVTEAMAEAEA